MDQRPKNRLDKLHNLSLRLQRTAMFAMTFLVMLTFMMTNLLAILWQSSDWLVGAVLPGVVASLTNAEREKYNVTPLSRSSVLDAAAKMKAEHMAAEEYFAHDSPGGITPWYWFKKAGYIYAHAGENLAIHFKDSDEVVKAWMNSPTHKANVIGPQYTEIGIGTAKGRYQGYDTVFVVQLFGTPAKRPLLIDADPKPLTFADSEITDFAEEELLDETVESDTVLLSQVAIAGENDTTEKPASMPPEDSNLSQPQLSMQDDFGQENESKNNESGSLAIEVNAPSPIVVNLPNNSFVATSSGLTVLDESQEFVAGTATKALPALATKPRTILQGVYIAIGSTVLLLLLLSIFLGYRSHRVRPVLVGVGLLLLMSVLFLWHIAVTGGAMIA